MSAACIGDELCLHFHGERIDEQRARVTHGDNPEHSRVFTAGVMPDGLCDDGHDLALERWVHRVMAFAHEPVEPSEEAAP